MCGICGYITPEGAREGAIDRMMSTVRTMLKEHLEKKTDHGQRLWLLCNAEIWYRMYIEGLKKDDLQKVLNIVA